MEHKWPGLLQKRLLISSQDAVLSQSDTRGPSERQIQQDVTLTESAFCLGLLACIRVNVCNRHGF